MYFTPYFDLRRSSRGDFRFACRDLLDTLTRGRLPRDFDWGAELQDVSRASFAKTYLKNGGWPALPGVDICDDL